MNELTTCVTAALLGLPEEVWQMAALFGGIAILTVLLIQPWKAEQL